MKTTVKIEKKMYDEMWRKQFKTNYGLLIFGLAFWALTILLKVIILQDDFSSMFIAAGVCLVVVPLTTIASLKYIVRNNTKRGEALHITLTEEAFEAETFKDEEQVGTYKIYYRDVTKLQETKSYLFCYIGKTQMLPLLKSDFSAEELDEVKNKMSVKKIKKEL